MGASVAVAAPAASVNAPTAPAQDASSGKREVLSAVLEAWKAADIDAVCSHLDDDVVWHYAAGVLPPLRGALAARAFLQKLRDDIAEVRWRIFNYAETGDLLFVEGVDEYIAAISARAVAPYAGVLVFRGAKICEWRDYFDRGQLEKTRAGEAPPEFVEALIARPAR